MKNMKEYKQRIIDNTILDFARDKGAIIYGRKALNERLPKPLYKKTRDFDMFISKPKINARKLEKQLDGVFQRNMFYVKKGEHEGTYKIKNNMGTKSVKDDKTVADLTRPYEKVPYEKSFDGIKFARLEYLKKKALKILSDKQYQYRWEKDKETLKKIKLIEDYNKKYGY